MDKQVHTVSLELDSDDLAKLQVALKNKIGSLSVLRVKDPKRIAEYRTLLDKVIKAASRLNQERANPKDLTGSITPEEVDEELALWEKTKNDWLS